MNVFSGDPAKPIDAAKRAVAKVVRTHSQATEVRNQVQCEKESGRTQSFKGDDGNFGTSKGFFLSHRSRTLFLMRVDIQTCEAVLMLKSHRIV